ncbi:MBOAT family O-acyltransferase [Rhodothermus profundi]|uniref:D-alanyl-lipoteichoic acid acyltransferase DltB, MBOAT superfamily n=1 Tax=Rhodothermus profundi TaxID=633813 RepID=A0A1M6XIZ5_9BACT|nr:MBOAT family O-acyltransferase [Rhodothermus profundi]SHL05937.1 D-alanyl-lipoteichoic acid acyltransferase DltB, MBOAT superfamily [Rhodothermus profundi]
MLFNSLDFLLFLPLVVALYYGLPARFRWLLLLLASYVFYAWWKVEYLLLIVVSTLIDYLCGRAMGRCTTRQARRPFLILSLVTNLGLLATFKYLGFFADALEALLGLLGHPTEVPTLDVLLPIGISFYTFQTLSYTIDVYRGTLKPERHLGYFALFVSFFPQLVAGPIERARNLLPQLHHPRKLHAAYLRTGFFLILWGFFKKVVIADRLALYVDPVFAHPAAYSGTHYWIALYFFFFQIFCDFSAYSDIAIGTARIFGIDLMENFRRPFAARSIAEFWQRWHISLTTWFRDYVYAPLLRSGGRRSKIRWFGSIFIVFVLSGLWHGAAWTFVLWGALHGLYLIVGLLTRPARRTFWQRVEQWARQLAPAPAHAAGIPRLARIIPRLRNGLAVLTTCWLAMTSLILFRASSAADAAHIATHLFDLSGSFGLPGFSFTDWIVSLGSIGLLEALQWIDAHVVRLETWIDTAPRLLRWSTYYFLILLVLLFGVFDRRPFIYFQF